MTSLYEINPQPGDTLIHEYGRRYGFEGVNSAGIYFGRDDTGATVKLIEGAHWAVERVQA